MDAKTSAKIHKRAVSELVLLTGTEGFIGGQLLRELQKRRHPVHAITWEQQANPDLLPEAVKKSQSVVMIHLAAVITGKGLIKTNVLLTARALNIARKLGATKFILVSSIKVQAKTSTEYARSKQLSEALVVHSGVPYAILRLGQVYGPGDTKNFETVRYWLTHSPVFPLPGGGKFSLQPVYITEVILALLQLMAMKTLPLTVVLAGKPVLFKRLIQIMSKELKRRVWLIPIPSWTLAVAQKNLVVAWKEGWKTLRLTPLSWKEGLQQWLYDKTAAN